jgi:stage IV sporulation protein FB
MRDLLSWNLSLGRWSGVQVRLHVFFVLFALFALHYAARANVLWYGAASVAILFASVLAHEFGHCIAAWKTGGSADRILLWPCGGLSHVNITQEPQSELATALAGPMVNLSICMLATPLLVVFQTDVIHLLNPLSPPPALEGFSAVNCLRMTFWINWLLTLVNLLPAFPLDGGRALRAVLWPKFGFRSAVLLVARAATITSVVLWLAAWLVRDSYPFALLPLALLGVFLFFSAKQETERLSEQDQGDPLLGYDFSQGYTSLEKHYQSPRAREPGPLRKWLDSRRAARLLRQQQIEEEEERRVDEVLVRLHEAGLDGLSDEDRALLGRVSARYRNRQRG